MSLGNFVNEPYMGMMRVARFSSTGVSLFESDVEHQHAIEVTICHADKERSLSRDWVHGTKEIVSVFMSEIQWAQFLSSMNQGDGVPVTLKHIQEKRIPDPPAPRSEASTFQQEMKDTVLRSIQSLQQALDKVKAALVPKAKVLGKGELDAVRSQLEMSLLHLKNNSAFVEEQFDEHVEKKLSEAKAEFEGYMMNRLRAMGLESAALQAAKDEAPKPLLEGKE